MVVSQISCDFFYFSHKSQKMRSIFFPSIFNHHFAPLHGMFLLLESLSQRGQFGQVWVPLDIQQKIPVTCVISCFFVGGHVLTFQKSHQHLTTNMKHTIYTIDISYFWANHSFLNQLWWFRRLWGSPPNAHGPLPAINGVINPPQKNGSMINLGIHRYFCFPHILELFILGPYF